MEYVRRVFAFILVILSFFIKNIVVFAGDDCMSMGMCPAEYEKYIAVDRFGNVIFHDVPSELMDEVKKWMKTDWGKQTFATSSGRNNNNSFGLKDLSDLIYDKLTEYYSLPIELKNHFVISKDVTGVSCNFDSFGPHIPVPSSVKSKINSDIKKIFKWMSLCREKRMFLPLEDSLR